MQSYLLKKELLSLKFKVNQYLLKLIIENDEYEIEDYVSKMENIVKRKLHIYKNLKAKLNDFKQCLRAEEEAHNNTIAKGFGIRKR